MLMGNKLLFLSLVLINSLFVGVLYVTFDDLPGNLSDIRSRHLRHAGIYPYVSSSSDIGVGMGSGGTPRQALTEALEEAGKSSRLRNPAFAILSFSRDHDLGSFLKPRRHWVLRRRSLAGHLWRMESSPIRDMKGRTELVAQIPVNWFRRCCFIPKILLLVWVPRPSVILILWNRRLRLPSGSR